MIKLLSLLIEDRHEDNLKNGFWGKQGAGILPLAIDTKRFLINHRGPDVQEPNTFNLWGGAINDDETPAMGARREFREETGYYGSIEIIPAYVFKAPNGKFKYYNFIGLIKNEFEPIEDWESQGYAWLTYDDVKMLNNKHFGLDTLLAQSDFLIRNILKKLDRKK